MKLLVNPSQRRIVTVPALVVEPTFSSTVLMRKIDPNLSVFHNFEAILATADRRDSLSGHLDEWKALIVWINR